MANERRTLIQLESKRRYVLLSRKKALLLICGATFLICMWLITFGTMRQSVPAVVLIRQPKVVHRYVSPIVQMPQRIHREQKLVILWTPFFSQRDYVLPLDRYSCAHTNCDFVSNRSLVQEADAVMFHARDTDLTDMPTYRSSDQRWILLHHEAPPNTPPHLMQALDNLINWTATYRRDSDIVLTPEYRKRLTSTWNRTTDKTRNFNNKKRLVAWFVSNCHTDSKREVFAQELRKTVTIDIFGSCGPFTCHPKMSNKCYQTIGNNYFFYLSLENAICRDYVTEKLFNILDYDIVPIAFGGVSDASFLPSKSFIDVFDFESTAALGQHLIRLAKDHNAYEEYFRWKSEYEMAPYQHYACQICHKLNTEAEPTKSWPNLSHWWHEEANCKSWTPTENDKGFSYDLT